MKCFFPFSLVYFVFSNAFAQPNTEVFLFDLNTKNGKFELSNMKNISNSEGYDNQPSFQDNNTILYAGTRNGQTDIVKYDINYDSKIFVNHTEGGEYSPLKIPKQNAVSAIRLDPDGKQFLYNYSLKNGENDVLIDDVIIGYHVWYDSSLIVSSVLENGGLSLYTNDPKEKKSYFQQKNIGRSLHKIPNSDLVSYISKENENAWEIKSLNPISGVTKPIAVTIDKAEDMCFLPDGTIVMGKENKVYTYTPKKSTDWLEATSLDTYNIKNISRLAVSPDGKKIAIVGESISTKEPINLNKKLEPKLENIAWISGTWHGEAFGGIAEEIWSEPSGGSMMASFKLINDGKVTFYEIEIIREIENSLILQLKHFNNDLKGWETKDETVDFPLLEITPNKVTFEGMVFEKVNENEMNVYVDIHNEDGSVKNIKFNYTKK
ncbi:MAG: DUF6265 family protein [Flavobacteriaceae bacterium]